MWNMSVISGAFSIQVSLSVETQRRIFLKNILVCKKNGDHEILSSAEQFLEERNLTGKVDVRFSITSLKEQNS